MSKKLERKIEKEKEGGDSALEWFRKMADQDHFGQKMTISHHYRAMLEALDRTMLLPDDPDFLSQLFIITRR